ncbi:ABC transporter ATP-binding protein/permease [Actinoallomurus purpureus]|uniref:ATP-binding cassette domain-containing protein n=1 Tax=Actinoallomurus purpureus TaxID=478114 RepID=UPI0020936069|nr:ABC transporter ATP-binding protein [Actinoallomurus purpureus]MCO6010362.1 ABC transporter ATP-binding protein/permease [Actinoallomurus purpureus]
MTIKGQWRRFSVMRRLLTFGVALAWRADRRRVAAVLLLQLLQSIGLGGMLLGGHGVADGLMGPAHGHAGITRAGISALIVMALSFVNSTLNLFGLLHQCVLRVAIERDAVEAVTAATARTDLLEFERPGFHDTVRLALTAAQIHAPNLPFTVMTVTRTVLTLATVVIALVAMAWWLLPLLLLAAIPSIRVALLQQRAHFDLQRSLTENQRTAGYLTQLLTGRDEAKELRAFGLGRTFFDRLAACYDRALSAEVAFRRRFLGKEIRARLAGHAMAAAAVGGLIVATASGVIGTAVALTALGGLLIGVQQAITLTSVLRASGDSLRYLDALRTFTEGAAGPPPPPAITRRSFDSLRARRLSFTYPGGARPAVDGVSIDLRPGEVVALVGENGSGKTTLTKLLTGLYAPAAGELLVDGRPVAAAELRALSTVLFQDYLHYKLSVAENIALGDPACLGDRGKVLEAARRAGVTPIVANLPGGYDTRLGAEFTGGTDLSLGQWQRVALARAFFRQAPLVVLDEPTAAMDARAEADLFARIRELFADRAVLLISHRFSSVRSADRIHVLRQGRVVEAGTHDELMAADGLYAEFFRIQAAAYLDDPAPRSRSIKPV